MKNLSLIKIVSLLVLYSSLQLSDLHGQRVTIPKNVHERGEAVEGENEIDFFYFPYQGPDIRVKEILQIYPNLDMPDTVSITPPEGLEEYENVYVFIGVIDSLTSSPNEVIIMLVGNYLTNRLTFFTDADFDRDFTNEFETLTRRTGDPARVAELRPWGDGDKVFDLWLSVDRVQPTAMLKRDRIVQRVRNQFSISPQIGIGTGKLKYRYFNNSIGFPTWYHVNSTARSVGLNVDYTHEFLRFSLGATYQNLYYWTSYLKVQTTEPYYFQDTYISGVTSHENRDKHATHRLEFSGKLAVLCKIGKLFDLQPFIKGGFISYKPDRYEPNPSLEQSPHREGIDHFVEAGLQLDVTSGVGQSAYVGLSLHKIYWQPEGFFEKVDHMDLDISYTSIRFFAGYRFGL